MQRQIPTESSEKLLEDSIRELKFFTNKKFISATKIQTKYSGNRLMCVECDDGIYAVRFVERRERNVSDEYVAHTLAAERELAPPIYCFDYKQKVLISQWLNGNHNDKLNDNNIISLVGILRSLHDIHYEDRDLPVFGSSLQDINNLDFSEDLIVEKSGVYDKYPIQPALCHNDLNPDNIIWGSNKPRLIDFEYAGINDIYFDLAAVSIEFGLSKTAERVMMEEYWQKEPFWFGKLYTYKEIYDTICKEWIAARAF